MNKKLVKCLLEGILLVLIIFGFLVLNEQITNKKRSTFIPTNDSNAYTYQVESIKTDGSNVIISGWFVELEEVQKNKREIDRDNVLGILVYDLKSQTDKYVDGTSKPSKALPAKVTRKKRADINEYFKCGYDYSMCGFEAVIDKSKLDLENGEYQIIIKKDEEGENGILADAYISMGKLTYTNPLESKELEVLGTDLERIVTDGICLINQSAYGIYVYQCEKNLYWIADENFLFEDDGSTYIQYQLDTTQFDRLPSDRIENNWYWSNLGDNFEAHEVTKEMKCGKYRVSMRAIPEDYSITRIVTGYYVNSNWIWQSYFRPIYSYIR